MRQVKVLLFAVLVVLVAANAVMAEEKEVIINAKIVNGQALTIQGYAPGEFALKGEIFLQIERIAKEIESKARQGGELRIMITGTTDVTGKSPTNDQLAMARAEQVRAYLASKLPDAKIYSYSRGQDLDARQVWVEYVLFAKEKNKSISNKAIRGMLLIFLGLIILSLMIKFTAFPHKNKTIKRNETEIKDFESADDYKHPKLNGASWINVGEYKVIVERREGKFVSPFRAKGGGEIIRHTREGMISSLKGCLKSSAFAEQKEQLIQEDKIRVAENTEVKK